MPAFYVFIGVSEIKPMVHNSTSNYSLPMKDLSLISIFNGIRKLYGNEDLDRFKSFI